MKKKYIIKYILVINIHIYFNIHINMYVMLSYTKCIPSYLMAYLTYRKKLYQIKLYLFVYECNNKANKMKCFLTIQHCKKHMLSFYLMYMIPYLFYFLFFFLLFIILCFIFQLPSSEEQWKAIADESDRRWNFPHCIGALYGKHVVIQ
jgi:hypothetical protein